MTIRSTACALALIAGTMLSACELERTSQTSDNGPIEAVEPAPQAGDKAVASTGFGVHVGSYEQAEGLTETWITPEQAGSRTLYYDPNPFITREHIAAFSESEDGQGYPALDLRFTDEGADLLRAVTTERIDEPVVFTVDGEVLTAPAVRSTLSHVAQVTGLGDPQFIDRLEEIFADAGAEKVDRLSDPVQEPDILPGVGIYRAATERTAELNIAFNEIEGLELWMAAEPMLTDDHIEFVAMSRDEAGRQALELTMTDEGAAILEDRADDYVGQYFVLTWQGRAVSAPRVMSELGRKLMITGPALDPQVPEDWMTELMESLSE